MDSPSGVYRQIDFTTNTVQRWSFAVDSSTENTVVYPTTIANSTGSIMHFANTSGVYTGMLAFAGYELGSTWTQYFPANTTVTAVTANTVTMSANATNAVALGTNITFGTNQGSNLFLQSMNDDGSDLATLLNFNRQTGDIVMDTASLYVSGDMGIGGGLSAGGYVVCDYMQVQTTNSDATVVISANASQNRQFVFQTGANNRWTFAADNTPESGTAIGSDFLISNYNNSGAFINNPLTIYRSNGVAVFSNAVSAPSFTQTSTTNTSQSHLALPIRNHRGGSDYYCELDMRRIELRSLTSLMTNTTRLVCI